MVALLAVLVMACGSAATSTAPLPPASQAATAATVQPAVSATPQPTPGQETIRRIAAAAYLTAAEKANKDANALDKKTPRVLKTLRQARAYYKAAARIEGAFVAAIKAITVPADTAGDLHSLIAKRTAVQALAIEGSGVKSWSAQASVDAALTKALRTAAGASNLLRSDLGLPPVHL